MKKELLKNIGVVTPLEDKTNIIHSFLVTEDFDELSFEFSYSPKILTDKEKSIELIYEAMERYAPSPYGNDYGKIDDYIPLVNLITLSVDSPKDYLGCAHRHANKQEHRISKGFSSYGFKKTEIFKGVWQAVVNLHCVITTTCEYKIVVYGEKK